MNGKDFIEMQKQDLETHKDKAMLLGVVTAMEEVLRGNENAEIDDKKTAEECFEKMREYARENASNGMYCFTQEAGEKFIAEYLGISVEKHSGQVTEEPKSAERKRRSLEDFF